jgi:hypothetical protein
MRTFGSFLARIGRRRLRSDLIITNNRLHLLEPVVFYSTIALAGYLLMQVRIGIVAERAAQ